MKPLKDSVVYQIYPASFKDSNGDGLGDIKGIISELDYLKSLGVDYLWLSPIYESPMVDMGYDISNYKSINPAMGTMEDFDLLVTEARKRDMGIIMDLVVNHTSNQHPWFKEAIRNPTSKYRNYYIFKKAENGKNYPNNWTTTMGGPAWEEVPGEKGTFYLHLFSKEQADLNWSNPEVINEVESIISFWLKKGVAGFRCDVINVISKDSYEDGNPKDSFMIGYQHYLSAPGSHNLLAKIQKDVVKPNGAFLIGETMNVTLEQAKEYLINGELDSLFEFETVSLDQGIFSYKVKPAHFKASILKWQKGLDFNAVYLENHDQKRSIGRFVSDRYPSDGAKMLLTLLLTIKGTPFIYQGQELGTRNYKKPDPFGSTDMVSKGIRQMLVDKKVPKCIQKGVINVHSRDDARAPMAFEDSASFGFTDYDVTPWQRYNEYSSVNNVEDETNDPDSVLNTFKRLIQIRKTYLPLVKGTFKEIVTKNKNIIAYQREYNGRIMNMVINLSDKKIKADVDLRDVIARSRIIYINKDHMKEYVLSPYEARIYEEMNEE